MVGCRDVGFVWMEVGLSQTNLSVVECLVTMSDLCVGMLVCVVGCQICVDGLMSGLCCGFVKMGVQVDLCGQMLESSHQLHDQLLMRKKNHTTS
eukprot:717111-Rhodomonas_salina.1